MILNIEMVIFLRLMIKQYNTTQYDNMYLVLRIYDAEVL